MHRRQAGTVGFALVLFGLHARCGGGQHVEGGAIVVRQVLTGATANAPAGGPSDATEPAALLAPVPGLSLGSTLIADSPRALYRRAYDQARRKADGDSPRERLYAIDTLIDQAATEPSALSEE